jgi:nitroreductase
MKPTHLHCVLQLHVLFHTAPSGGNVLDFQFVLYPYPYFQNKTYGQVRPEATCVDAISSTAIFDLHGRLVEFSETPQC